jgi:hypothetical protein
MMITWRSPFQTRKIAYSGHFQFQDRHTSRIDANFVKTSRPSPIVSSEPQVDSVTRIRSDCINMPRPIRPAHIKMDWYMLGHFQPIDFHGNSFKELSRSSRRPCKGPELESHSTQRRRKIRLFASLLVCILLQCSFPATISVHPSKKMKAW